ncbi:hypothetical protein DIU31_020050 [Mucilaginibacter rubeus]|uniref:Uncharacterized protein n=1 Tax=Mucilaginibacter rubeus TaxID=2027860 RepID=A0AAE6JHB5_9SPHI|nr:MULTISPECIES: hypothetical protein [Mucilaginibacter]QEM05694.1 hypothetical protein DIU31_020050 [Mucilaginibacter rubeus]QEM18282.1 hypothetical protein DIU38_020260 [Mucilaginibacter gossypii]QTE45185.1 hypothetical protein J3L19_07455 [Mucilaginibacter rubeus]QTE51781.1 hypothetical protein J3L21_07430 [Mucilaginibacter rubeus]QTE56868.1 hypothetical protein J3L23_32665 [Mucilaginibacter rubeus]
MAKIAVKTYKEAVEATPDVKNCFQAGLSGLGTNSTKVNAVNTRLFNGSVNIDLCTATKYANENRWDYSFGYNDKAYFIEVHPANTSEVDVVIKKLQWLKNWLSSQAPELNKIKAQTPYYWIQSGKGAILPGSNQARKVAQAGIKPMPSLRLS